LVARVGLLASLQEDSEIDGFGDSVVIAGSAVKRIEGSPQRA
jgi:hypothetical protein